MSDNDLIRRGDVMDAAWEADSLELATHGAGKIAARINAIPAAQPTVKPLVWTQIVIPEQAMQGTWWKAAAITGDYEVHQFNDRDEIILQGRGMGNPEYPTIDAAKAAAQADYEARILSALDVQPTVSPDVAALVEQIMQIKVVYAHQINTGFAMSYDPLQRFYIIEDVLAALARVKGVM